MTFESRYWPQTGVSAPPDGDVPKVCRECDAAYVGARISKRCIPCQAKAKERQKQRKGRKKQA